MKVLKAAKRALAWMMYSPSSLYTAGSDVIGCRRPTGCVFVCMLQTRVTLTAFPIEDAARSPHEGEQIFTLPLRNFKQSML